MEVDDEGASGQGAESARGPPAPGAAPLAAPVGPPASLRPAEPAAEDAQMARGQPMPRQPSAVVRERLRGLPK
eukprot:3014389-Alexandrium_andersonii.AAC.1